jgi:K+/H+ antiporter YhaU regulatory subunit KhtT
MNVALFILVVAVSFVVVRIGAILFELTGLEWSVAKFQALSCFSSTGFTTREAELITGHPQRRRIASLLIVLGNAGLVTLIATFANSIRPRSARDGVPIPFIGVKVPFDYWPIVNLVLVVIAIYVLYRVFTNVKITKKLTDSLKRRVMARMGVSPISFEEMLLAADGYGVSQVRIPEGHEVFGKTLAQSDLRKEDIIVLAVVRGSKTMPNPRADTAIQEKDELVCFGKLESIRKYFEART